MGFTSFPEYEVILEVYFFGLQVLEIDVRLVYPVIFLEPILILFAVAAQKY